MVLSIFLVLLILFGCTRADRDNPLDPDGINYVAGGGAFVWCSGSGFCLNISDDMCSALSGTIVFDCPVESNSSSSGTFFSSSSQPDYNVLCQIGTTCGSIPVGVCLAYDGTQVTSYGSSSSIAQSSSSSVSSSSSIVQKNSSSSVGSSSSIVQSSSSSVSSSSNDCGSECEGYVSDGSGVTTRYWDSCKPSCATANAGGSTNGTAMTCDVRGVKLTDPNARNSCESGGTGYACANWFPWAINDSLAYGFATSRTNGHCGKCFLLQFSDNGELGNSGDIKNKKMVIMVSNIGGDVSGAQFALMIPGGGGTTQVNAFSNQISQNGGGNPYFGQQSGGFRAACGNDVSCIREKCTATFGVSNSGVLGDFMKGCDWYIDWFKISNNPRFNYKDINCPPSLVSKYKH